jgi:hypothetical protein
MAKLTIHNIEKIKSIRTSEGYFISEDAVTDSAYVFYVEHIFDEHTPQPMHNAKGYYIVYRDYPSDFPVLKVEVRDTSAKLLQASAVPIASLQDVHKAVGVICQTVVMLNR